MNNALARGREIEGAVKRRASRAARGLIFSSSLVSARTAPEGFHQRVAHPWLFSARLCDIGQCSPPVNGASIAVGNDPPPSVNVHESSRGHTLAVGCRFLAVHRTREADIKVVDLSRQVGPDCGLQRSQVNKSSLATEGRCCATIEGHAEHCNGLVFADNDSKVVVAYARGSYRFSLCDLATSSTHSRSESDSHSSAGSHSGGSLKTHYIRKTSTFSTHYASAIVSTETHGSVVNAWPASILAGLANGPGFGSVCGLDLRCQTRESLQLLCGRHSETVHDLSRSKNTILHCKPLQDGRTVVTGGSDGRVCVWDIREGRRPRFILDSRRRYLTDRLNPICEDVDPGKARQRHGTRGGSGRWAGFDGNVIHTGGVTGMELSATESLLFTRGHDFDSCRLWRFDSRYSENCFRLPFLTLPTPKGFVRARLAAELRPGYKKVASARGVEDHSFPDDVLLREQQRTRCRSIIFDAQIRKGGNETFILTSGENSHAALSVVEAYSGRVIRSFVPPSRFGHDSDGRSGALNEGENDHFNSWFLRPDSRRATQATTPLPLSLHRHPTVANALIVSQAEMIHDELELGEPRRPRRVSNNLNWPENVRVLGP